MSESSQSKLDKLMKTQYNYPDPDDPDFQNKIYEKREFYYNKLPTRPEVRNYDDIKQYRDKICTPTGALLEHQAFLGNFINPNTPYRGILIFHGTGTGKTCAAIAIAEKFKNMVQRYNTKIYVLVSGPLIKENWKNELLKCTGDTYISQSDKSVYVGEHEQNKMRKIAMINIMQYYRFMSYRSFYKKVLGEKVSDIETEEGKKGRKTYRKTKEGEYERNISVDKITSLNNSVIIVDEAHNLTGNVFGDALRKIIKNSKNLRVVLLSATPMKNLADDIIDIVNYVRPMNSQIQRDRVFTGDKNYKMEFKEGGMDYLKNMCQGYISYLRGADPLTFAKRIEKGVVPKGLLFTKVVQCKMLPFQKELYLKVSAEEDSALERQSTDVANFIFPGLSNDTNELVGYYGREGLQKVVNQSKTISDKIGKLVVEKVFKNKNMDYDDLIFPSQVNKTISGSILKFQNLEHFSTKFYQALKRLNRLYWGDKGPRTAFIYSNLVKVGIELFEEVLLQNGYLEFLEDSNEYDIKPDTVCYYCGKTKKEHDEKKLPAKTPEHEFKPAAFITITGKAPDEMGSGDVIPEDKHRILKSVFNHIDNLDGKNIKFVLGSKVMTEGLSLANVKEVHILDVYFNLGKVDQVIGRAIRHCSHHKIMAEDNPYPQVNVYKYAVVTDKGLSSEEDLYKKAEQKYLMVKKVERLLKEVAVDCPLNRQGNVFPEELEKFKNCGEPGQPICPALCDYMKCNFKCDSKILNHKHYDPGRNIYKAISKDKLDYSTFTHDLAKGEIEFAKSKIKEMYKLKHAFTLDNIVKYVKKSYSEEKQILFDEFFVYKALDFMIPVTENDFNTFKDIVLDKFSRPGYIIHINKYYIFQPFDRNEDVPMYHRTNYDKEIDNPLSLHNYLKHNKGYKKYQKDRQIAKNLKGKSVQIYDFDSVMDYYDNRNEHKYVGIVDKETSRRASKLPEELKDVFKIREKRSKILDKKRGTGIPSLKGAVCATSKDKEYLEKIAKYINISVNKGEIRSDTCNRIKAKLLELEKFSTGKDKMTYVIIPRNHPEYKFPYNLEDRVKFIKDELKQKIKVNYDLSVSKKGNVYTLTMKGRLDNFAEVIEPLGGKKTGSNWVIKVD